MTIIKWILFFVLAPFLYCYIVSLLSAPFLVLPMLIMFFVKETLFDYVFVISATFVPLILAPFAMYFCAKIFGVFRGVDGLNIKFYKKILLIFLISFVLFLFMYTPYKLLGAKFILDECSTYSYHAFSLIQSFFIYKLLQHLTQKHPVPFRALAYYFSIEFYRTLIKNSYHKIKNKFTK